MNNKCIIKDARNSLIVCLIFTLYTFNTKLISAPGMYTIGYNCASTQSGGELEKNEYAGIQGYSQRNWNNTNSDVIVADKDGESVNTNVVIIWECNGFGSSRNNLRLTDGDRKMMTGYFATGNSSSYVIHVL